MKATTRDVARQVSVAVSTVSPLLSGTPLSLREGADTGIQVSSGRDAYEVAEPCAVELTLRLDRPLTPADRIRFQFPNSWSIVQGPTYTRAFQSSDPAGAHHLSVSAPGGDAAAFEIGTHEALERWLAAIVICLKVPGIGL